MTYTLFYDTNSLLNIQEKAFEEYFIISQKTLEEIENIKTSSRKDGEIKCKARKLARLLDENINYDVVKINAEIKKIINDFDLEETPDNMILASAYFINKTTPIIVVSDDINVKFISRNIFGLYTKGIDDLKLVDNEEYTGFKEVVMDEDEMSYFYSNINDNIYDLKINEYLIIKNSSGNVVDNRRWDGNTHKSLNYSRVRSDYVGKVEPLNNGQALSFDMLQNDDITIKIISGKWGSGKDFIMVANAINMISSGKYEKLIYIRNNVSLRDVPEMGFLPGDMLEKLAPYTAALGDHVGGTEGLLCMMDNGQLQIEHLGFIRGRTFDDAIVLVSEAENMTKDHVQLLISRIGKNSILMINGDYKQVDSPVFRLNNGLMSAIECLKGHPMFGFVKLSETERSETAKLAELLD